MEKRILPGMLVTETERPARNDHFITAFPRSGEEPKNLFARVARIAEKYSFSIVSMEVYGVAGKEALSKAFESITWPVTWVDSASEPGVQAWAVTDSRVAPVEWEGRIVGSAIEEEGARYLTLESLEGKDLQKVLASREMDDGHVVRKSIGGGVLAVKGLDESVAIMDVPPPVENPPAVRELVLPDFRYVFITAAGAEEADAALKSRGMDWGGVVRVVALNQKDEEIQKLDAYLDDPDTAFLPLLQVQGDAGEGRPLFEVDAGVVI